jgi:hypothetical protein
MANYQKFNSFVEALAEKVHDLGSDQLKIALTNTAPSATNTKLTDISEIAYTNLKGANPLNLTTTSSAQTNGTYKLVLADLTLEVENGPLPEFRYVVIYNDSASNKELIGFYDYGSGVELKVADQFILNFDNVNGVIQIV